MKTTLEPLFLRNWAWTNAELITNYKSTNNLWAGRTPRDPHGNGNQALLEGHILAVDDITRTYLELTAKLDTCTQAHGHEQPILFLPALYISVSSSS